MKIRTLCQIVFLFALFLGQAQGRYETGKIIDTIPVIQESEENYALYLPTSYKPDVLNPILFIFDPAGRGKTGVEVFKDIAEKYNFILVCSNTIRNGSYERNLALTQRLFDHVFKAFSIDEDQIYLSGFSGGARLATSIACLTDQISGVVACGAGFGNIPAYTPSTQKFSYVGLCGDKDMNFTEMLSVKQYLKSINFNSTVITYSGDHKWPPKPELLKAFDWLSIQAHKEGKSEKPKSEIYDSYLKYADFAEKNEKEKNSTRAVEQYEHILSTYQRFYVLDSIKTKLINLKKSKTFRVQKKSREDAFKKENQLTDIYVNRFFNELENPKKFNLKWWQKNLTKIELDKESPHFEYEQMKYRLRFRIFALAYEKMRISGSEIQNEQKEFCKKICHLIYPEFQ